VSSDYLPPPDPLDIIHADHEILIANKPSGLLSVPGKGPELADCLMAVSYTHLTLPTILRV